MRSLSLKNIKIKLISEKRLDSNQRRKIIFLKKQYWKYSLNSHLEWHLSNIKKNDKHFLVFSNNKLIFYLMSRRVKCKVNNANINLNTLDFICVDKTLRGKKISDKFIHLFFLMINSDNFILTCKKSLVTYYKQFGFKSINKKIDFYYKSKEQRIMIKGLSENINFLSCNYLF